MSEESSRTVDSCAPAGAAAPPAPLPQNRRPRVREVSSRFMTPLISSSASSAGASSPFDHRSKSTLRRHPHQQSLNEPLSSRPVEDENIPDVMRNSTGSQMLSKAAILLSTVQRKPQQKTKVLKENGGSRFEQQQSASDSPAQSKRVSSSSSSSSRPDTPYARGGAERIVPSRYRVTPHPIHRQTQNHCGAAQTPFSAAAQLVQESTSTSNIPTPKDDYDSSDNESVENRKSYPNSPVCITSSKIARAPWTTRASMPEVDRWLIDKNSTPKCVRSLSLSRSSSDSKSLCLPPQPTTKPGLDKKVRRGVNNHPDDDHSLKMLQNHYLQWRYANAKAEASVHSQSMAAERKLYSLGCQINDLREKVSRKRAELASLQRIKTLTTILETQSPGLEEWSAIENEYSASLSGATSALQNASLQLPVSGVRFDSRELAESFNSATKVMEQMHSDIERFVCKAEDVDSLASDLARVSSGERSFIEECGDLLMKVHASQITECSLKGHMVQLSRITDQLRSST
ncbi:unnamed protein product [Cuscuta epithymum]|uniref:Uncharacterized protein n=1 Tax=Cuscuta epithymum TaxID=186058 RepID=A0AAV0EBI2_9ASTE|nr:unnamed protein product [Cuscuta epithymum]